MVTRLPKSKRVPEAFSSSKTTERDLSIIRTLLGYRLATSSQLIAVVGGNEDVTYRRLQRLFHLGLINRVPLPKQGPSTEFVYYLDEPKALRLLAEGGLWEESSDDLRLIRSNRKKAYADAAGEPGKLLFLQHELMVSRFHFMLDMACREDAESFRLASWKQGPELWANVVVANPQGSLTLPHRPDAFASLEFTRKEAGLQHSHFFYEADRGTMNTERLKSKFRAYIEFLGQLKHTESYGIKRVRAVLIETVNVNTAQRLREAASELCPDVPLFWFTGSDVLAANFSNSLKPPGALPKFNFITAKIWATTTDDELRALAS